jgi:hypothetical protein
LQLHLKRTETAAPTEGNKLTELDPVKFLVSVSRLTVLFLMYKIEKRRSLATLAYPTALKKVLQILQPIRQLI